MSKARPMLDDTPAAVLINDAWRGIRDWTRELRVPKDLQGTVERLHQYANLNLMRNHGAGEYLGAMLMAQKSGNEDYLAFMTSKRANGQPPFFKAADLSPDTTLQLLVQVGGKYPSRSYEGPNGKSVDGPASVLTTFSRDSMNTQHGTNLSALQILYFTCRASNKVRAADWAEGMHAIICSAVHEYASQHGLERDLKKKYMVKPPRLTDEEIKAQFDAMKERAKKALAEGVPRQRPSDGPVETFNEMVGSLSRLQMLELYNTLGGRLGVQVAASVTPESALAATVTAGRGNSAKPARETAKAVAKAPVKKRTSVKVAGPKREV